LVVMEEKTSVLAVRLSAEDLERVEAVRTLEKIDRSTLIREFIQDGLRRRVLLLFRRGALSAAKAAEILGVPLREFLAFLEDEEIPVNWDSKVVKDYMKKTYGE